jgi:hypothetical protein
MNTLFLIAFQIFSLFQLVNNSIPVTDCNVTMINGEMESGYTKEVTLFSPDCALDWGLARLETFEDGGFYLSFAQLYKPAHQIFAPFVYKNATYDPFRGYGFTCHIENEVDHALIVCESTSTPFPYTPAQEIDLGVDGDRFTGCLPFGDCTD